jgi:hypothetical protein
MKPKPPTQTPFEKEVRRLHALGKSPDIIAIRMGVKMSRILALLTKQSPAA